MASKKGVEKEVQLMWKPSCLGTKKDKSKHLLLIIAVLFFVLCILMYMHYIKVLNGRENDCVGHVRVEHVKNKIYLSDSEDPTSYFAELGKNLHQETVQRRLIENGLEYKWKHGPKLVIKDANESCTLVHWSEMENIDGSYPQDCFALKDKNWYGGGELYKQIWPLEKAVIEMAAYYPQDTINAYYQKIPAFGPVLGRYWVNSGGFAVVADQTSPLVVGINAKNFEGFLCLTIDPSLYPDTKVPAELKYTVCQEENVKIVHEEVVKKFFKKLSKGPDETMMRYPLWSTWVKYHKEVNQMDVEQFLDQIVANNFSCSQVEIDDKYTTTYGDYDFDPIKFPSPKDMIEKIHNAGCRVTTWVHPFAEVFSKAFVEGKKLGSFVVGPDGKTPGLVSWWNGYAAAVDVTKPSAYAWFLNRLKEFQTSYNIDSFKFDAGSVTYLPYQYTLNGTSIPSDYSVQYAKLASEINNMVEVRVGDRSQDLSVFVRFLDRDASWNTAMGLQSVIPTVLTFGILGYPFILPDMIGGNGDPDKELFIRWLQLNTFLPSMQFSHVPWDFDNETVAIAHKMMAIRESIMPTMLEGVDNAVKTGEPIIRPLWWIAPNDPVALTSDQQFMITDVFLVAPVVNQNATKISVYLPKGIWMEEFGGRVNHTMSEGGNLVYDINSLADVFYFKNTNISFVNGD